MNLVNTPQQPPENRVFKTQTLLAQNINNMGKVQVGYFRFPCPRSTSAFAHFLSCLKITLLRRGRYPSYSWSYDVPSNSYFLVLFVNPYFRAADDLDDIMEIVKNIWPHYGDGEIEFVKAYQGTESNYQDMLQDVSSFISSADTRCAAKNKRTFGMAGI